MATIVDPRTGVKLVDLIAAGETKILIVFWHGLGDLVMFMPIFRYLQQTYPNVTFGLGLAREHGHQPIFPESVQLEHGWEGRVNEMGFDTAFICHYPIEDASRPTVTKNDICCEAELGIPYVSEEYRVGAKRLVGVHFQGTSCPGTVNAQEDVARRIWQDVLSAGCVPIETHFQHVWHNGANGKYPFVSNHVRDWPADLDTLMAIIGGCGAFIGVLSGNALLAMSILGNERVMILENGSRASQFIKGDIRTVNVNDYNGEVRQWLESLGGQHEADYFRSPKGGGVHLDEWGFRLCGTWANGPDGA